MTGRNTWIIDTILFTLYLAFFISLVFSFRAISSVSIALILLAGLIKNGIERKKMFPDQLKNPMLICCAVFLLIQLVSLTYTINVHEGWKNMRLKSALIIIPFSVCCSGYIRDVTRQKLLRWYCLILSAACLIALCAGFSRYLASGDASVLVYHKLVYLYSGHAIQFSILVFVALVYLVESLRQKQFLLHPLIHSLLLFFLVGFLFLLSSKLVIAFFILYFIYTLARLIKSWHINKLFIVTSIVILLGLCSVIFFTRNPISNRFEDILQTNFNFLQKEKYTPGDYFNGLQFRMLQWKFVPGILNEQKAWLNGVGVGDAQGLLNQKYINANMYIGTVQRGDKGFIGYNTHNQFLEALLQTGIIGSLAFLVICGAMVTMIRRTKDTALTFITILLIVYSFSESVFETQYSLFIFLFFPLFYFQSKNNARL